MTKVKEDKKKEKYTVAELLQIQQAVGKILEGELDIVLSYKLMRIIEKLESCLTVYNKKRKEWLDENMDKETERVDVKSLMEYLEPLLKEEESVELTFLTIEELSTAGVKVSGSTLFGLKPILKE